MNISLDQTVPSLIAEQSELQAWFASFPGLLWSVEVLRSRISLLNHWRHPVLAEKTPLLLKDRMYRKQAVVREDLPLLAEFWDVMANMQPAAVTFRLKDCPDEVLLLQGWPHPDNGQKYMGMLKLACIPQPFALDNDFASCQMALTRSSYPVFLLDSKEWRIITCNHAAQSLFALEADLAANLSDIAPGELLPLAQEAVALAVRDDVWGGVLALRGVNGATISAKVRISPATEKMHHVVRVAFLEGPPQDKGLLSHACPRDEAGRRAFVGVQGADSFRCALETLLNEHLGGAGEALLFSDIKSRQGRVEVYAVGKPFASREWGEHYAYEGTIAQDIERFDLHSLVVDDTLDSIKSIDWVLFNPRGIRSYFAKPFFSQGSLHAVLIIASTTPSQFSLEAEKYLAHIFPAFEEAVRLWRQGQLA